MAGLQLSQLILHGLRSDALPPGSFGSRKVCPMPIVGHNETLPLLDLVQNKASEPGSHRFTIEGSKGAGLLVLEGGRVVHAEYGNVTGEHAAVELLTERSTYYLVRSGSEIKQRTMSVALSRLLLAADIPTTSEAALGTAIPEVESGYSGPHSVTSMRREEVAKAAAQARSDRRGNIRAFPNSSRSAGSAEATPVASAHPASAELESKTTSLTPMLLAAGAILMLSAVAFFTLRGSTNPPAAAAEPTEASARPGVEPALEVSDLGPQDQAPTLVTGDPVPAPDGTATVLSPTITCRILVDAQGQVSQAEIYRSRPDLAAFEKAALNAVRSYRFEPARVRGEVRPVWINYPVRFTNS